MNTDLSINQQLPYLGKSLCTNGKRIRHADCHQCVIRKKMLFADLDLERLDGLLEPISNLLVSPGAGLYRQGDTGIALYSVRKGLVKLTQVAPDGFERIVHLAGPGSTIGMEGFLHKKYRQTAEAVTEADICAIPVDVAQRIADSQPVLYHGLLENWQRQFEQAESWMLELTQGPVKQRLARLLLMLDHVGQTHGEIRLLNNQDSAGILATTVETVSRNLAEFKRNRVISKVAPATYQLDLKQLQQIAATRE